MSISVGLIAMLAALQAAPATPQQAGDQDLDVVVTGQRNTATAVQSFIAEVAAPPRRQGLATWDRGLCVGTVNFRREHAEYLIDRIARIGVEIGLEPGAPGCRPDVMIIGTTEATALATELVEHNELAFRPTLGGSDLGSRALREFASVDRPVRWWLISLPVSVDTGQVATQLAGGDPPSVTQRVASRSFSSPIRQELKRGIVIVDLDSLGAVNFAQLADYIAMTTLAQLDMNADATAFPTVLNAFQPGMTPTGLTQWDLDYLQALYAAPNDRRIPRHQMEAIAASMTGARRSGAAEP